jgi:hypothetical protein
MRVIFRSASALLTPVAGRKVERAGGKLLLLTEEWVWQEVCTFT